MNLFCEQCSRFPQFREEFFVERVLQVRRACAATGSHTYADHSFDQLNVAQPPAYDQCVEFRQALAGQPVARRYQATGT